MSYAHIKLDTSGHSSGMAEVDEKCQVIFSYVTSLLHGCFFFSRTLLMKDRILRSFVDPNSSDKHFKVKDTETTVNQKAFICYLVLIYTSVINKN